MTISTYPTRTIETTRNNKMLNWSELSIFHDILLQTDRVLLQMPHAHIYENVKLKYNLSAPCGGSINYSGCIHVNFVDINK